MRRFLLLLAVLAACLGMRAQDMGEHVRLTNLPHIYIDTFTGEGIWSKDIMVLARMWYVDEADNVSFFDSLEVRVRGNSTASLAKKPYKLKFAFTGDAGALAYLDGREFSVERVDFVEELFPAYAKRLTK